MKKVFLNLSIWFPRWQRKSGQSPTWQLSTEGNHTVLLTAYAVNPYRGSEDGTGWNIIRTLGEEQDLIAITRRNNREAIERFLAANPEAATGVNFQYYDLPKWLSWWKNGSRGALLYHYLWHLGVVWFIWRQQFEFDLAHHLNFHADWCPSFLWLLGKPFVWGPVGHHPPIPAGYLPHHSRLTRWKDQLRWRTKQLFWHFDPFLQLTKRKAAAILAVNSSVATQLRLPASKVHIVPAIATELPCPEAHYTTTEETFRVLSVGRFCALKGFDMAITAFARFYHQLVAQDRPKVKLTLIGKGADEAILRQCLAAHKLPDSSWEIIPWLERAELDQHFRAASVFFFPSHEGAGMVVPEAMSYGLPILTYDNVGPGETAGHAAGILIPYTNYAESAEDFAEALLTFFLEPEFRQDLGWAGRVRHLEHYLWEGKSLQIQSIYNRCFSSNISHPDKLSQSAKKQIT